MLEFFFLLILATAAAKMESFIVGGQFSDIHKWPFIALLYVEEINQNGIDQRGATCGGSLISSQTVLTAAHCTDDLTEKHKNFGRYIFSVYMGDAQFTKATMVRRVKDYVAHNHYDPSADDVHCDISLMFLESPVRFSHTVKKVILVPTGSEVTNGMKVEVAGWGMTDMKSSSSSSTKLKAVVQKMITTHDCRKSLGSKVPGIVCAGSDIEFAYRGDSGGPLVRKSDHYQVGIVSYRVMRIGVTVYTSVEYYHNWIRDTQEKLFKKYCPRHHHHHPHHHRGYEKI